MQRVAIIGSTGMLGSMVYSSFKDNFELVLVYKNKKHLSLLKKTYGKSKNTKEIQFSIEEILHDFHSAFYSHSISPAFNELVKRIGKVDAVINCAGIIKPYTQGNEENTFFINGAFPHLLSSIYKDKLIHITTDCVYSGVEGAPYDEESKYSPNDLYGLSKNIGEPYSNSLVLRTSIIGPEIHGYLSLLEWVKNQKGEIRGYTNHLWNGVTTKEFALTCKKIIENRSKYPKNGLYHIFSTDVTKYEMVKKIAEKYNTNIKVKPTKASVGLDRRLRSVHKLCKDLHVSSFDEMLKSL
jgi:dTDP-4-dehydrorhamnose reductase